MRVLFILEYYYPYQGGAERLFTELTRELCHLGDHVAVLTANYTTLPSEEVLDGVHVTRITVKNRLLFTVKAIPKSLEMAKDFDIIHTSTYNAALPAKIASIFASRPIVITVHEYWGNYWWRLPFLRLYERFAYHVYERAILSFKYSRVIAVSNFTQSRLGQASQKHDVSMIYNGLPRTLSPASTIRSDYYLFVGRLGVSKGIDVLTEAIAILLKQNPTLKFKFVVPNFPYRIFHFVRSRLSPWIEFVDPPTDQELWELMSKAKALIVPSYTEGFGFVAAEAAKLGTPIISSGRGALKEVVSGKFLEMKEHSASALVDCILSAEMGRFLFKPILDFDMKQTVRQHQKVYRSVLNHAEHSPDSP
ncbi:MAG: glycosyltransferase family 4 protein [Flavobacteriales bacterium]